MKIKTTMLAVMLYVTTHAFTANNPSSNYILEVKGQVSNYGIDVTNAYIILFCNNQIIENKMVERGKFSLKLKSNNYYVLEVRSEGFLPKRIVLNTNDVPDNISEKHIYEIILDLVPVELVKLVDHTELDFPYAVITYDKAKGYFMHNQKYAAKMQLEEIKVTTQGELEKKYLSFVAQMESQNQTTSSEIKKKLQIVK
jgi:hypothetical protein